MADRVGQQLGNYRLVRLLGRGGFAEVYLGEHRYLKSHAALKVLLRSLAQEDAKRFLSEAQTLVRLIHPNIVRVLEYAVERGTPVLVMDYAPGGTIRQRHPRGSCLSLATTVAYVKQVAAALQYAHNHNIIHRDVKPENILLGSERQILLSDFGLAVFSTAPELLSTQEMAGTIPYTAPEQLHGKPSFASDQYALGIVTYEWLCGKRPFEGTPWEIINQHMSVAPPSLRATYPELPAEVEAVVLRALAKDPRQRFVSVQAFAHALERACQKSNLDLSDDTQVTATLGEGARPRSIRPSDATTQRIFLSAAPADDIFVAHLKADLEVRGALVWNDRSGNTPNGLSPEEAVRQGIRAAHIVLVVISPHTRSSNVVKEHMRIASIYERQVVFLWAEGDDIATVLPDSWGKTVAVDLFDARQARYEHALDEILSSLQEEMTVTSPLEPSLAESLGEPRNPYKGLRAFTRDDSTDFFGRDALIQELMATMRENLASAQPRLLTVIGSSGSGKSSVVMAGLLPRLQNGLLPGSAGWVYLKPMIPGKYPLESLALVLSPHFPNRSLKATREDLEDETGRGLYLLMTQLAKQTGTRVVLVVDQFEELFTQTTSEEERRHFIKVLVTAVRDLRSPAIVILTLRADFYDRPLSYPDLGRLIQNNHRVVLPMEIEDLRGVIEQPAALPDVQLTFEGNLVGDLLFETQGQAGALPLLEFTLDQLFQRREGHWLTLQAYQDIGGVKGALAKHAESIYASLPSDEHRRLARALFLRLIDPGMTEQDTTRRRAALAELSLPDPGQTTIIRAVADAFITARLLTTNVIAGETTIEVSHEALIREWGRLSAWLGEARDDISLQQTISADAADWIRRGRPVDRLYRGTKLTEAQAWAERNTPSRDEVAFLQASAEEHERQQADELSRKVRELNLQRRVVSRQRLLVAALSIFSVVVIILALLAEVGREQADTQRQIASSRAFAAQAYYALTKKQVGTALLLSAKANQTYNTFDARDSLLNALEYSPHLLTILQSDTTVTHVEVRPDNQTLIFFNLKGEVTFWNMKTRQGHTLYLDFRGKISSIENWALSPDGQVIAGASSQGLWLWDAKTGERIAQLEAKTNNSVSPNITPVVFSPDGKLLALGHCTQQNASNCTQGGILLWNVASQKLASPPLINGAAIVTQFVFSPDGKTLVSSSKTLVPGSANGGIQRWDTASGRALTSSFAGFTGDIQNFALSPDGKTLAASDGNETIYLWDVASQQPLGTPLSAKGLQSLAFSPDGNMLASGGEDGTIQVWNTTPGLPSDVPLTLIGHGDSITSLAFSPDGKTLASSDLKGMTLLWNMATGSSIKQELNYTNQVFSAIFSPDGKMIVAGDDKGMITLRDAATGNLLDTLDATLSPDTQVGNTASGGPLTVENLAFSPDKRILAAGRFDGMIFLWDAATRKLITHFRDEKYLRNIAFNPNSHILAASYENGAILLWDVNTGHVLHRLVHPQQNSDTISTIAFSPDGKMLASGDGNTVVFWDTATGKRSGQPLMGHQASVKSIAFSPDGHILASIDGNSTIIFWDSSTMKSLDQPLVNVDPNVTSEELFQRGLTFSPDGTLLAAGGDQSVTVWNVTKRERIAHAFRTLETFGKASQSAFVRGVTFSPDGQQVLIISDTYSTNYHVASWNINTTAWQSQACSIANRNFTLDEWKRFIGDEQYQKVCPHLPIDGSAIRAELKQAHADVQAGRLQEAQATYIQAMQEAAQLDDANLSNDVCWAGSTDQFAKEVLPSCKRTVSLNPYEGRYYDSRGVAQALTGDRRGAIEDFKFFVQWATEEQMSLHNVDTQQLVDERNAWIQKLEAGQNPFDIKTLQALRVESQIDG